MVVSDLDLKRAVSLICYFSEYMTQDRFLLMMEDGILCRFISVRTTAYSALDDVVKNEQTSGSSNFLPKGKYLVSIEGK